MFQISELHLDIDKDIKKSETIHVHDVFQLVDNNDFLKSRSSK